MNWCGIAGAKRGVILEKRGHVRLEESKHMALGLHDGDNFVCERQSIHTSPKRSRRSCAKPWYFACVDWYVPLLPRIVALSSGSRLVLSGTFHIGRRYFCAIAGRVLWLWITAFPPMGSRVCVVDSVGRSSCGMCCDQRQLL